LLTIALIPIVVKTSILQERNTEWETRQRKHKSDLLLASNKTNHHKNTRTPNLTWFDKSAFVHGEEGRNYIENREEK